MTALNCAVSASTAGRKYPDAPNRCAHRAPLPAFPLYNHRTPAPSPSSRERLDQQRSETPEYGSKDPARTAGSRSCPRPNREARFIQGFPGRQGEFRISCWISCEKRVWQRFKRRDPIAHWREFARISTPPWRRQSARFSPLRQECLKTIGVSQANGFSGSQTAWYSSESGSSINIVPVRSGANAGSCAGRPSTSTRNRGKPAVLTHRSAAAGT